jgi:hypothetical protein
MAASRCFNTIQPNQTSSDYLNQIRQTTIFNITNNAVINNNFKGSKQKNFKISTNTNNKSGCLIWADSYESLADVNNGKTIVTNEVNNSYAVYNAPFYTITSGNAYDRKIIIDTRFDNSKKVHVQPYMSSVKIAPTAFPVIQNYIKSINQKQLFNNSTVPGSIYFGTYY